MPPRREDLLRQVIQQKSLRPAINLNSIYVQGQWEGHFPIERVRSELEKMLKACIGVVSVKVLPGGGSYSSQSASNRAFVNFDSPENASRGMSALRSTTATALGKGIRIAPSLKDQAVRDEENVREMLTVVARNVPGVLKQRDLEQYFQNTFGDILRVWMAPHRNGDDATGLALIQFIDKSSADAALAAGGLGHVRIQNVVLSVERYRRHHVGPPARSAVAPLGDRTGANLNAARSSHSAAAITAPALPDHEPRPGSDPAPDLGPAPRGAPMGGPTPDVHAGIFRPLAPSGSLPAQGHHREHDQAPPPPSIQAVCASQADDGSAHPSQSSSQPINARPNADTSARPDTSVPPLVQRAAPPVGSSASPRNVLGSVFATPVAGQPSGASGPSGVAPAAHPFSGRAVVPGLLPPAHLYKQHVGASEDHQALFCCPITHDWFKDPVVAPDGHVYERTAIEEWLQTGAVSPFTEQPMDTSDLRPVPGFGEALRLIQALAEDMHTIAGRVNLMHSVANQPLPMPRSLQLQKQNM